jgi:hypothetical protein
VEDFKSWDCVIPNSIAIAIAIAIASPQALELLYVPAGSVSFASTTAARTTDYTATTATAAPQQLSLR